MLIRLLAVFAVSVLLIGCEPEEVHLKSGKVVKIGVIAPFSGPEKAWGENGLLGIKTALELKPYLLNGDKPELILEDDKNDPELTVKALHKLATEDQVSAILIFSDSEAVLAVVEEAEEYKIPILALIATHPEISGGEGEHPAKVLDAGDTPFLPSIQDNLCVAVSTELITFVPELHGQLYKIVYLTVVNNTEITIGTEHGLLAGRQVDN